MWELSEILRFDKCIDNRMKGINHSYPKIYSNAPYNFFIDVMASEPRRNSEQEDWEFILEKSYEFASSAIGRKRSIKQVLAKTLGVAADYQVYDF